jgi:hypothetical protein
MFLSAHVRMFCVHIALSLNGIYTHVTTILAILHTVMPANKVTQKTEPINYCSKYHPTIKSRDSAVGIETGYGLGDQGVGSR